MAKAPQINQKTSTVFSTTASTWGIRSSFQLLMVILIALVVSVLYLSRANESRSPSSSPSQEAVGMSRDHSYSYIEDLTALVMMPKCDLFSGKWVFDNQGYPLYKEECTFMSDQLACEKFGRQDLSYQFWRWQPHHCDLPRFNATALLERLRNKRLVFVGDSLNRGQWISMVCLVETNIPSSLKSMRTSYNGSLSTFKATKLKEYNASIEFYWAPLLESPIQMIQLNTGYQRE